MKRCLLIAFAVLAVGALVLLLFLLRLRHFLTVDDGIHHADAIIVLGGDTSDFNRARHGVALFDQGVAPLVLFSGGTMLNTGLDCSSAQLSLQAAAGLGLPPGAARLAPEAQSTYDEALNLRRLAAENRWEALVIVTDPFHTRRAVRTFRTLLPGVQIHVSAAPDPAYDPTRWWATEDGLVSAVNELLKLGFYWLNHGIRPF